MAGTKSFLAQELSKLFEAVWLDLPAEAGKLLLGSGDEQGLRKAGWKAYDAWIVLANEFTNAVYSNSTIGEVTGRAMESALRLRQLGGVLAAAFFGNFWPSIGLPTRSEIVAVRDELLVLREELASYAARFPVSADAGGQEAMRMVSKGTPFNAYSAANANGRPGGRFNPQVQRHVAA
jgi:hypothetical protein